MTTSSIPAGSRPAVDPVRAEALLLAAGDPEEPKLETDAEGRVLIPHAPLWRPGVHLHEYVAIWPASTTPRTRSHRHGRLLAHVRVLDGGGKVRDLGLRRLELVHWILGLSTAIGAGWVVGRVTPMLGHGAQLSGIPRRRS
ncbi:hypothetical protein [Streptomyces katrae]|uniref:Uncharacterized protein n=1 Tax=Streptomyces katrae TaxID=68223 RepID=A0A0F4JTN6_9ACTN|nr:hypothetical protein [Streptomyces katrae]KJY37108.1 hypothetical protein VR44_06590 [Streptomyces katrae]